MPAIPSGADVLANTLLTSLTTGLDFDVPPFDPDLPIYAQPGNTGPLYEPVAQIDFDALTSGVVGGTGVFDKLMVSLVAHLKIEFTANRISGAEYTKAYIGIIQAALQTSQQFLLAKDQAYWQSLLVQAQARAAEAEAVRARLELETSRVNLIRAQFEAATTEVNYGLTKMKLSTEDATYANMILQGTNLTVQTANLTKQGVGLDFTNTAILPQQEKLLKEQVEVQRSQTLDTRSDGASVVGSVGKQKDLYGQQIVSYKRDAETKAAKIYSDAYITRLTILDGGTVPTEFTNAKIDVVMNKLRTNLDLTDS